MDALTESPNQSADPAGSAGPDLREVQRRALSGAAWGLLGAVGGIPIAILATFVLARELGVEGFGKYSLCAFVVPTVVSLSDVGLSGGLAQRGATAFGEGDRGTLERVAGQALSWSLIRWPVIYLGLAIFLADAVASLLLAVVALVSMACGGVSVVLVSTVRNAEMSRLMLCATTANAVATVAAALAGQPPVRVFAIGFAAQFLVLAWQVIYLRQDRSLLRSAFRPASLTGSRDDFLFGGLIYASAQMTALTMSRSELLFFQPAQSVARGVYAAGYTIGSRLTLAIDALFGSLGTSLSAVREAEGARVRGIERTLRLSQAVFALTAGPGIFIAILSADLLFPGSFGGLVPAAIVLSSTSLLVSAAYPLQMVFFAHRRVRPLLLAAGLALAANIGLSLLLIPSGGLSGAVAANAASGILYVLLIFVLLLRSEGADVLKASVLGYGATTAVVVASASALGFAIAAVDPDLLRWALGAGAGALHALLLCRMAVRLTPADVDALRRQVPIRMAKPLDRVLASVFGSDLHRIKRTRSHNGSPD